MTRFAHASVLSCTLGSLFLLACGGASSETPAPSEPAPTTTSTPAEPAPAGTDATAPDATAPDAHEPSPETEPGAGRLAFVTCESPRKTACTREYRPVCAEVDTGIRCIKAPCPSSEKKQYGNGCSACADEKVIGYFPAACDSITAGQTP